MKDYEQKIKLLDSILTALIKTEEHSIHKNEFNKKVYAQHLKKGPNFKYEFIGIVDPTDELNSATQYLIDEKMISFIDCKYRITYRGILHLSKGGYAEEYKKSEKQRSANMFFWKYTPIIAIASLIISIIAFYYTLQGV